MLRSKFTSNLISSYVSHIGRIVVLGMFTLAHNFKIFDSIVVLNSVNMVDNFAFAKIPAKVFLHYKSMFQNISSTLMVFEWMFRSINKNITIRILYFSAFPICGLFSKLSLKTKSGSAGIGAKFTNAIIKISTVYREIFMARITFKNVSKAIPFTWNFGFDYSFHNFTYDRLNRRGCQ